jgi:hypothetical protein
LEKKTAMIRKTSKILVSVKATILASVLFSAGPAFMAMAANDAKQVTLWDRVWTVAPMAGQPDVWRATRDTNGNDPFGKPAIWRPSQGIRALETATGCTVDRSGLAQTISGAYIAPVICN